MNFNTFRDAFKANFAKLAKHPLYDLNISGDDLREKYLNAFGNDDALFRVRGEHNCTVCKNFVRDLGGVVAIVGGKVVSVWEFEVPGEPVYQRVADQMAALKDTVAIRDVFLRAEQKIGTATTRAMLDGTLHTFHHFNEALPAQFVRAKKELDTLRGNARTTRDMLGRTMAEFTVDALDEVLELIASNTLYRGAEFKTTVLGLRTLKGQYDETKMTADVFAWANAGSPYARARSTVIGTLIEDLSAGKPLEEAVRMYESKVAPANYKRPTALVTPKMVEQAKAKVDELGLTPALHRRYAALADISINNVLFADRSAKQTMLTGGVFDDLATKAPKHKTLDRVDTISIEDFIKNVLPTTTSLEVFLENKHLSNLVSLVTEAEQDSPRLFKWDNPFTWSYVGDVTDSIKERVKAAGGNVTGDVCCRLAWNNYDDLDFHMVEPDRTTIYYASRNSHKTGGALDVDMNAGGGNTREPVENIFYPSKAKMKPGKYVLKVNQFHKRESKDNTFTVQIDIQGTVHTFEGKNPTSGYKEIAQLVVDANHEVTVVPTMESSVQSTPKEEWAVRTQDFRRANVVLLSPNHWEGETGTGNKHYFFMLDGCVNSGNARGFYNEFLRPELEPHRKVLEMVGDRQRTDVTPNQLSGLGFSSTKRDELVVRVTGAMTRTLKVTF